MTNSLAGPGFTGFNSLVQAGQAGQNVMRTLNYAAAPLGAQRFTVADLTGNA
jgi:hypothetical protein